jgi:hypothetical protein
VYQLYEREFILDNQDKQEEKSANCIERYYVYDFKRKDKKSFSAKGEIRCDISLRFV